MNDSYKVMESFYLREANSNIRRKHFESLLIILIELLQFGFPRRTGDLQKQTLTNLALWNAFHRQQ